jgi:glycosyltransferase involved in cell wall biosynthesis
MKTLSAVVVAKNEEDFVRICLDHLEPFVDEIIFVDNGSVDKTKEIASFFSKVKIFDYPAEERVDMGKVRNFSIAQATSDWILQVDCDEIYPESEMKNIRSFIEETEAISARVHYKNLAWRSGYAQKEFGHYPDRLYRRNVIDGYFGMLPNDMMKVKLEYLLAPNKKNGDIGVLEYDNDQDQSFVHPRQPIIDVTYFHLARTRGYNFEYNKWKRYNRNLHPSMADDELEQKTRINNWVSGLYEMEPVSVPENIPKKTIKAPKVSVIITNFNYEDYVDQAITSVLNQSYKVHEIIVVDDYSGDNSLQKIRKFPVTVVARDHNGGPGAARNDGISRATGDYFLCLDADDRLRPNAIERLLSLIHI